MHNITKIFIENPNKLQTLKKMLADLGYNVDNETVESMLKILYDDYNIEVVPILTVPELACKALESTANKIVILERYLLPKKQQNFSREQLEHFNRLQNTRFKTINQRQR